MPIPAFTAEVLSSRLRCEVSGLLLLDTAPMFAVKLPAKPLDAGGLKEAE